MKRKLYIVNNGLKDLRGHYFETAVSIAEAARDLGWQPLLGAHQTCPRDLAPDWLPVFPVFGTDHWMSIPLPRARYWAKCLLPHGLHEPVRRLARSARKCFRSLLRTARAPMHQNRAVASSPEPLAAELDAIGARGEYRAMSRFFEDLSGFLDSTVCGPLDHVFLPTAHGRDLAAVQKWIDSRPVSAMPTFHLEFRHDLHVYSQLYRECHQAFFRHFLAGPCSERIRLYTDTEELAGQLAGETGLPFTVLPIPFRSRFVREPMPHWGPLTLAYFGEVRDEKGFPWLPDLVDALMDEHVRPGRLRFLIQASLDRWACYPSSQAALKRLRRFGPEQVRLVGSDGPLTSEEYYQMVRETDVFLCPYDPDRYRCRSSGTLAEAIAAGIPTVVPADTWMSRQQDEGTGETFTDKSSFIQAVRRIVDDHASYRRRAQAFKHAWLAVHSPANFVAVLLGQGEMAAKASA